MPVQDLNDFNYVDNSDIVYAAHVNNILAATFRAEYANTETITGTKELDDADLPIQIITPSGADRVVELASEATTNHSTFIINPSGSSYSLVIKDDAGSITYATIQPGNWVFCVSNGYM